MTPQEEQLQQERWKLLYNIIALTRTPMTILSLIWIGLIIAALVSGLPAPLAWLSTAIWALFILDFLVQILVAPRKLVYMRRNWITAISLALPVFAMLRIFQGLRVLRVAVRSGSFSLVRILAEINHGMASIRRVLGHRNLGFVVAFSVLVMLAGAAGMYAFENPAELRAQGFTPAAHGGGLHNYAEAVWWTGMVMTTFGSAYWPVTLEGRILCLLLAFYALSIFGYVTASVASYFIGGPAGNKPGALSSGTDVPAIQSELAAMREQLAALGTRIEGASMPNIPASTPDAVGENPG
jgi:voltage-gated potassium channel